MDYDIILHEIIVLSADIIQKPFINFRKARFTSSPLLENDICIIRNIFLLSPFLLFSLTLISFV